MFGPSLNSMEKMFRRVLDIGDGSVKKIQDLKEEMRRLKEEKEELEFKKKMEEKEIAHLVKMKEEKIFIEMEKKEIELTKKFNLREMDLQRDYHVKILRAIDEQRKESKDLYTAVMERLPNVNVDISRG